MATTTEAPKQQQAQSAQSGQANNPPPANYSPYVPSNIYNWSPYTPPPNYTPLPPNYTPYTPPPNYTPLPPRSGGGGGSGGGSGGGGGQPAVPTPREEALQASLLPSERYKPPPEAPASKLTPEEIKAIATQSTPLPQYKVVEGERAISGLGSYPSTLVDIRTGKEFLPVASAEPDTSLYGYTYSSITGEYIPIRWGTPGTSNLFERSQLPAGARISRLPPSPLYVSKNELIQQTKEAYIQEETGFDVRQGDISFSLGKTTIPIQAISRMKVRREDFSGSELEKTIGIAGVSAGQGVMSGVIGLRNVGEGIFTKPVETGIGLAIAPVYIPEYVAKNIGQRGVVGGLSYSVGEFLPVVGIAKATPSPRTFSMLREPKVGAERLNLARTFEQPDTTATFGRPELKGSRLVTPKKVEAGISDLQVTEATRLAETTGRGTSSLFVTGEGFVKGGGKTVKVDIVGGVTSERVVRTGAAELPETEIVGKSNLILQTGRKKFGADVEGIFVEKELAVGGIMKGTIRGSKTQTDIAGAGVVLNLGEYTSAGTKTTFGIQTGVSAARQRGKPDITANLGVGRQEIRSFDLATARQITDAGFQGKQFRKITTKKQDAVPSLFAETAMKGLAVSSDILAQLRTTRPTTRYAPVSIATVGRTAQFGDVILPRNMPSISRAIIPFPTARQKQRQTADIIGTRTIQQQSLRQNIIPQNINVLQIPQTTARERPRQTPDVFSGLGIGQAQRQGQRQAQRIRPLEFEIPKIELTTMKPPPFIPIIKTPTVPNFFLLPKADIEASSGGFIGKIRQPRRYTPTLIGRLTGLGRGGLGGFTVGEIRGIPSRRKKKSRRKK